MTGPGPRCTPPLSDLAPAVSNDLPRRSSRGPVEAALPEGGLLAPETYEATLPVEHLPVDVTVKLAPVQFRPLERGRVLGVGHVGGLPAERGELPTSPFADGPAEVGVVVIGEGSFSSSSATRPSTRGSASPRRAPCRGDTLWAALGFEWLHFGANVLLLVAVILRSGPAVRRPYADRAEVRLVRDGRRLGRPRATTCWTTSCASTNYCAAAGGEKTPSGTVVISRTSSMREGPALTRAGMPLAVKQTSPG